MKYPGCHKQLLGSLFVTFICQRKVPSTYYSRPVRLHNPDDLEDDAALSKEVRGQYTVKAKPSSSIGFKPVPGQQLTSNPLK